MSRSDPFGLIGKRIERTTSQSWTARRIIKAVLADGRVIVELNDKQMMKVDPEKDEEWKLVASSRLNSNASRWLSARVTRVVPIDGVESRASCC
jgi:hypothetical protein